MPTYDYECQACSHHFERWQEMSARKLRTCPECGKRKLVRLVGAGAGVIFKGSGFYETDYKRKQQQPKSSSSSSNASSDASESASKSASKGDGGSSSSSSKSPSSSSTKTSSKSPGGSKSGSKGS